MIMYSGDRDPITNKVVVRIHRLDDAKYLPHFERHSPDGFEWGYNGSGPSDLALSILANHFDETPTRDELQYGAENEHYCLKFYIQFRTDIVSNFSREGWLLSDRLLNEWVRNQNINNKTMSQTS